MFVHRDGSGRIIDVTGSVNRAELEKLLKEQDEADKKAKRGASSAKSDDKPAAKSEAKKDTSDDKAAARSDDKPSEKSLPTKYAGSDKPTEKSSGGSASPKGK